MAMAVLLTGSVSNTGFFEQVFAASVVSIVALVIGDVQRILVIQ